MYELILLTRRLRRRHDKAEGEAEGEKVMERITSKLTRVLVVTLLCAAAVTIAQEKQSLIDLDALAARGEVLANQDPPWPICEAARRARERNSPAAPGLEETCRAALAAKGKAIANENEVVAEARNAEPDALYQQGFDIATAIFGDPALGAQGNTSTGPGSLGIRDSLSAAGQRGFNASVAFNLSRRAGTGTSGASESPVVTKDDHFGTGSATGRARAALQPENTIKVTVRYKKEFGYVGDTNAFGYVGPTSCSAFSVSVVMGDGSAGQQNPFRISSDSKMEERDGYYFCTYLVSDIPLNQPVRVSVSLSSLDQSGVWKGGSQAQPAPGQQRTIIIVSGREGGPLILTATQPRATQLFEMVYTTQPR
jgi:hypothetical protein